MEIIREIFLSLGSNQGDRQKLLTMAVNLIERESGTLLKCSSVYETEPWEMKEADPFLNQVIQISSSLPPLDLLMILQKIETNLGRTHHPATPRRGLRGVYPAASGATTSPISPRQGVVSAEFTPLQAGLRHPPSYNFFPRPIDIDILFYSNQIIDLPGLVIPHPRIPERRFVLVPLAQIAGGFIHPALGKSIRELLEKCQDRLKVKLFING